MCNCHHCILLPVVLFVHQESLSQSPGAAVRPAAWQTRLPKRQSHGGGWHRRQQLGKVSDLQRGLGNSFRTPTSWGLYPQLQGDAAAW